jgi:hypothetical protein
MLNCWTCGSRVSDSDSNPCALCLLCSILSRRDDPANDGIEVEIIKREQLKEI